nr:hypothetical protein BgiMline_010794 [Biomphalaria glabrata]
MTSTRGSGGSHPLSTSVSTLVLVLPFLVNIDPSAASTEMWRFSASQSTLVTLLTSDLRWSQRNIVFSV